MAPWIKAGTTIKANGEKTIQYVSFRNPNAIESRKVVIPHANGRSGVWYHTSYFLIRPDGTEKEYWTLAAAKEAAEKGAEHDQDV
jgi:hypothetical protein